MSSIEDQVVLHEMLSCLTDGYNVPLLGFNPWKAVGAQKKDYFNFIYSTLEKGIFRGVKIYPTLGYSPNGEIYFDLKKYLTKCSGRPDLPREESLIGAFDELYDMCERKGWVVMAHSNRSQGVSLESPELAGPKAWGKVLKKHPSLSVNFGHMGSFTTVDKKKLTWTHGFFELMDSYPNVYGDVGNWMDFMSLERLTKLKDILDKHKPQVQERLMYGSDWFMINSEPGWKNYLTKAHSGFYSVLGERRGGGKIMEDVFYNNAMRLFGVGEIDCADGK